MRNYYTVYLKETEEIVAFGYSIECAKQLKMSLNGFHSLVSKNKSGKHKKYEVLIEKLNDGEYSDDVEES